MLIKNLTIINNEKISEEDKNFFCDNIDIKTIPENLGKKFNVSLIARKSKIKRKHKINIQNDRELLNKIKDKINSIAKATGNSEL